MSFSNTSDKRVILVTGANKGIGYEAVKALSQSLPNATILLTSRSLDNGHNAIKKMQQSLSNTASQHTFSNVKVITLDVIDPASIQSAIQTIQSSYGHLDVLIHNSGISNVNGDMKAKAIFDVNVDGSRHCIEAFLPIIPTGGTVIIVSSEVGAMSMNCLTADLRDRLNDPSKLTWEQIDHLCADWLKFANKQPAEEDWSQVPYAYRASKTLLSAWSRVFALQHPELKVAVVCPGHCATDLNFHKGIRPASVGGESIIWPVFHTFESGHFYQDGKDKPYISANGQLPPKPPIENKE